MTEKLTLRPALLGAILSIVVAMYSAFLGLKIGGVYWPVITTSLMALAILKIFGNTNKNEINLAQTAASAGGLLAAGIIFTIPAAMMLGLHLTFIEITLVALVGGITGVIFSIPLRKEMIENESLPFPDGTAAAKVIEAGDDKGSKAKLLGIAFGIGALFSIARDYFAVIPAVINLETLKSALAEKFSFGASISLVALAGGFLIGPVFTGAWFFGAIISNFLLLPSLIGTIGFADKAAAKALFASPLGIGIVIGAAIAYFLLKALPALGRIINDYKASENKFALTKWIVLIVLVGVTTIITQMNWIISILAIFGAFIMSYIGARITGEMNVDPMEIFAMIVLIAAKLVFNFLDIHLIILAAIVAIAAGIAGDFMQDLKAGSILGTNPREQTKAQLIGVIAASLVIGIIILALSQTGFGTIEFPAPQAVALKGILQAQSFEGPLAMGVIIGFILTLITTILNLGILPVAFGIGIYVPIELSFPLFIGGMIRLIADKLQKTDNWRILAAGVIGGEGFIGVLIAITGLIASGALF